ARMNWSGVTSGLRATGLFVTRKNDGFSYDHTYAFSRTVILDARVGFSRFTELARRQHEGVFDPASLGFSTQSAALFGDRYLPRFDIGGFSPLGDSRGDTRTHNIYVLQPTITKLAASHSFKMGYDFRSYRENSTPTAHSAGIYYFRPDFTVGPFDYPAVSPIGQDLASFLLGLPTASGSNTISLIDRNASRSNQTLYQGVFFQDDWKFNHKL